MRRVVKDFIEIKGVRSLDALIERLTEVRDTLPEDAEPEVRLRGDDVFGRQIAIAYVRPQTEEEAECEARYADAYRAARERETYREPGEHPHLRMVA